MARSGNRWAYLGRPDHNPPTDACPVCEAPSKTWFIGSKTIEGVEHRRYQCEHGHNWILERAALPKAQRQ